jgi:hypothetical protein
LIKLIIKLAIVALVANAAWHLMTAYTSYYKFKDAVQQTTQFGNDKSLEQLKARVVALANDYDLPLGEDDFTIRRESFHTIVDGSYTKTIDLVPGYSRPWPFDFHIDTFSEAPMTGQGR